jgi:hypothetical protein
MQEPPISGRIRKPGALDSGENWAGPLAQSLDPLGSVVPPFGVPDPVLLVPYHAARATADPAGSLFQLWPVTSQPAHRFRTPSASMSPDSVLSSRTTSSVEWPLGC